MTYADVRHWYEEPDDPDEPNGHCYGTDEHGCGRFVTAGAFHCARCLDEIAAHARWLADEDARIEKALADEHAYYDSPEGRAELAEHDRYLRECSETGASEVDEPIEYADAADDLPF